MKLSFAKEKVNESDSTNRVDAIKKSSNKSKEPISVESDRNKKNIWKWLITLIILGLFSVLIFYTCFAKKVNEIKVQEYSYADSKLTLKSGSTDVVISLDNNDGWSNYYLTTSDSTVFTFYANSDQYGTVSFRVEEIIVKSETGIHIDILIGSSQKKLAIYDSQTPITSKEAVWFYSALTDSASIPTESISWGYIILNLLPTILIVGITVWLFVRLSKMQGGIGGEESIFGIGKSQAKIAQSNVKFSDVAGIEEEKAELIEIVDYLKNPEKYASMGARTPKGVILYGPPGTGKTLLAKAVAGEAKVPFFQVSGSAFEDMLVGVGAKRVRDLFAKAKKSAPSIIFIDELDSVASKRGKYDVAGSSGLADQTINQLLAEMDGFNTRTGIVVIAATNRIDVLDDAILRPGRFDRHIQVNLPDIKEREAILKIHARNKNISSKVNLADIARRTPGFSGAQLENVLNEATLLAVRLRKTTITEAEIDEAIDRVLAGPAKKTRVITEEEKKQIAYHEAGHALIGLHMPGSDVVEKITIIPRGYAAGYTLSTPEKQEITIQKKSDLLSIITSTLGGRATEEVVYGKDAISTGASNDLYKVTNIVRSMVTQLGMTEIGMTQFIPSEGQINPNSIKLYSDETANKIDEQIEAIIQKQYAVAKDIIRKNRKELDLIVESLLLLETIVKNQIDYIHKNLKLPKEALERKEAIKKEKKEKNSSEQKTKN